MNNIYVVRGTEQAGPFTDAEIRAQLASGELTGDSMVWWDGLPEWTALSKTPLASPPVGIAPAAPIPAPAPGPIAAPAPAEFGARTPKTSVLAIVSLVTGIAGFPTILCWPVALMLDLAAIITGHIARSQIRKDPSQSGKGMALAGLICGYFGIFLVVAVVIISVLIALGAQTKSVFETIQSQMTNSAPVKPGQ